jgi:hypothetical protein
MESFSADARIVPAYSVVKARQDVGFYIEAIYPVCRDWQAPHRPEGQPSHSVLIDL